MRSILIKYLSNNRIITDVVLILLSALIFLLPALYKINLHDFSIDQLIVGIDDWNRYARHAIDINENGLLISNDSGNYLIPAGFLYNYFIALCFELFGENPAFVYCMQSALLGTTIALSYFIFRDFLKPKTGWLLLIALIVLGYLDIYLNYSFRLLSENLAIFTIMLFFLFLKKMLFFNTNRLQVLTGTLLGISQLTRPNIILFSIIFLCFLIVLCVKNRKNIKKYWLVLISYSIVISLLPLRNFIVTGDLFFLPADGNFLDYMTRANSTSTGDSFFNFLKYYFDKLIFCLGYLPILEAKYQIRPHWFIMWAGFMIKIFFLVVRPIKIKWFELSLFSFVITFYLILILIAPISNYGFRFVTPALFIVLGISFMGYEQLYDHFRKYKNNKQLTTAPKPH